MAENHRNRWLRWAVVVAVLALVAAGGIWHFRRSADAAPKYQTVPVTRGELTQLVTATGTLNPVTNVQVGCQISGTISKIYVDYNSLVKAGQLIAEIDPRTYQAQEEQAEADLANAKANLELQEVETKRESQLFANHLVSESDYDTAVATLHEAAATVQLKQAALDMAKANLGYCKIYSPVDGIVIVNNIEVGQTVAASFNTPELFQIANNLAQMQIDSSVAEADVGGVKDGQGVDFTVEAYPNRTFQGIVTQVRNAPTTVNNVVTYDCVIGVTNADYKLMPGMTATVSITVAQRTNVLKIPNAALRFHPPESAILPINVNTNAFAAQSNQGFSGGSRAGGFAGGFGSGQGGPHGFRNSDAHTRDGERPVFHTVYLVSSDDGNARLKPVQIITGVTDNVYTEVVSGLKAGDQVVTGLAIPGLTTGSQTQNPFAFRRF